MHAGETLYQLSCPCLFLGFFWWWRRLFLVVRVCLYYWHHEPQPDASQSFYQRGFIPSLEEILKEKRTLSNPISIQQKNLYPSRFESLT